MVEDILPEDILPEDILLEDIIIEENMENMENTAKNISEVEWEDKETTGKVKDNNISKCIRECKQNKLAFIQKDTTTNIMGIEVEDMEKPVSIKVKNTINFARKGWEWSELLLSPC